MERLREIFEHNRGYADKAIEHYQRSLDVSRERGDQDGEADCLFSLARAYNGAEQTEQAIECYNLALDISRESGNQNLEGITLVNLGLIYANTGYVEQAIESYQRAIIILEELESPTADTVRRFLDHLIGRDQADF
jgi:tetratricopeptide (TPR) repeat protein